MPEPINPQDHSIGGGEYEVLRLDLDESLMAFENMAIVEAIHQTFERDAEAVERPAFAGGRDPDPDTEIDRQARLIVDGEYRRRREAESND